MTVSVVRLGDEHELGLIERDGGAAIRASLIRLAAFGLPSRPGRPRYQLLPEPPSEGDAALFTTDPRRTRLHQAAAWPGKATSAKP
jgi:hypothetical protein